MNPRTLLFKSGAGLDLRGHAIRSVQITKSATGKLSIQCNEIDLNDTLAEQALSESTSKLSSVIAVPTAEALMHRFELPFQSKRAIKDIVTLELERRLPTDIAEWHHTQLSPAVSGKTAVLLTAAIPKHRLTAMLAPLHDKGWYPSTGLHAGAILTLLTHCAPNEYGMFLEVGEEDATLIIKSSQHVEMVRGLRYGTRNAALLAQEVRRTVAALSPDVSSAYDSKITILGSAADAPDFTSTLSNESGLEVRTLPLCLKGHEGELPSRFAVAAGAAFQACNADKNLIFSGSSTKRRTQLQIKSLRVPAVALAAVLLCAAVSLGLQIQKKSRVLEQITRLQTQVFRRALPDAPKHLRPSQYTAVLRERISRLASSPDTEKKDSLAVVDLLRLVHLATQDSKVLVRKIMINGSSVTLTLQADTQEQLQRVSNNLEKLQNVQNVMQRQETSLSTQGVSVATTRFTVQSIDRGQHQ